MKTQSSKREKNKLIITMLLSIMFFFSSFTVPVVSKAASTSPTVNYAFDNDVAGDGTGVVTMTNVNNSDYFVLYWGGNSGKLSGYSSIMTLSGAQALEGLQMVNCLAIPEGASKLLAYLKNGSSETKTCYSFTIPTNKRAVTATPITTMFFLSDTHIDYSGSTNVTNFDTALKAIKAIDRNAAGIIINGDLSNQGTTEQYNLFQSIIANNSTNLPTVYCNFGNHDSWTNGSTNYTTSTGNSLLYDTTVGNQHLVFIGETTSGANITLSDSDLSWLDQKLAADVAAGKHTFVFLHQSVSNTVSATFPGQWAYHQIDNEEQFLSVLNKYPSAILVSGHSHMNLDARVTALNGMGITPSYINDASTAYLTLKDSDVYTPSDDGSGSQGLYVKVYSDHITIYGRDFINNCWIPRSSLRISLVNSTSKLPANLSITGTSIVGSTLTANITPSLSNLAYVWYADGCKIGTSSSYTLTSNETGKKISLFVYEKTTGQFASAACEFSVLPEALPSMTKLYIDKGSINIGNGTVSGYDINGNLVKTVNSNGYIITQSVATSDNQITINGGTQNIVLQNVNFFSYTNNILIQNNANVTMTLQGNNTIAYHKSTSSAAIQVTGGSSLLINGTPNDKLRADHSKGGSGAGIGGTYQGTCGNITINGGEIDAIGGTYAAAIGGSSTTTTMGKITINGGNVFASVNGYNAAAIGTGWCDESQIANGTGGSIEINGGVIYAIGANNTTSDPYGAGAGIGAGPNDHLASITINGGSINSVCGTNNVSGTVNDIGNSGYADGTTLSIPNTPVIINGGSILSQNNNILSPKNTAGNSAILAVASTGLISKLVTVTEGNSIFQATTEQDGKLYLYIPSTISTVTVITGQTTLTFNYQSYDVTFNSNGGSSIETQTVIAGSSAMKPADPIKAGYTLDGWYFDAALTLPWDFNTEITTNITLYAKWYITPTMTLDKTNYRVGEKVTVTFTGARYAKDWFGINQNSSAAGNSIVWCYLNGTMTAPSTVQADGTITIDTSALTAGTYYIYYCINDGYSYYTRQSFTVS